MEASALVSQLVAKFQNRRGSKWTREMEHDLSLTIEEMKDRIRKEVICELEKILNSHLVRTSKSKYSQ